MLSRLCREQNSLSESQVFFAEQRRLHVLGTLLASLAALNATSVILTLAGQ